MAVRGSDRSTATARAMTVRAVRVLGTALGAAWVPASASGAAQEQGRPVERFDSAGVEIVVNQAPAWGPGQGWTVSAEPALVIGSADGAEEYLFSSPGNLRRLSDSRILLVPGGREGEIRVFDAQGRFLNRIGRLGGGPGEFSRSPEVEVLRGDTIATYDFRAQRLSFFTPEGELIREGRLVPPVSERGRSGAYQGFRGGVSLFVLRGEVTRYSLDGHLLERSAAHFLRVQSPGAVGDTILTVGGYETFARRPDTSVMDETSATLSVGMVIRTNRLGRSGRWAVGRDRIVAGVPERIDLGVYDLDGRPLRRIRAPVLERPLTREALDSIAEVLRERGPTPEIREWADELWDDTPVPEIWPPFDEILLDTEGNIWLRPRDPLRLEVPSADLWTVFDPTGRLLGQVEIPAGIIVHEIGEDYVLGVTRDELEVPYVVLHRIRKPGS